MSWTITGTSYPNIVTGGLVLNLDAGSKLSYPGTGTSWLDLSGNGNTGTLVNGPTYSSANGGAIVFDGVNDYGKTNSNVLLPFKAFTANFWVRTIAQNGVNVFAGLGNSRVGLSNGAGFWVGLDNRFNNNANGLSFVIVDQSGNYAAYNTTIWTYAINTWYNICATWTYTGASTAKIFVNGTEQATSIVGSSGVPGTGQFAPSSDLTIGSYDFDRPSLLPFNGNISQGSIYNRALTATEVSQNFNALRGRYGI